MRQHPAPSQSPFFGLIAWLEQTRIQLPLRAVDCRFRITGDVAVVEMDQVFQQTASRPLNVTYTFPLPHGAATYQCEMHVNGRVIRAKVMEQLAARQVAAEQKKQGRRTALVEVERDNLFTLELGNLAPNDIITIRFSYFQTVDRLGTQLSLRIPFCPGIRYIPGKPLLRGNRGQGTVDDTDQVPDASRLSPPRIDAMHPDAAGLFLEGTLIAAEADLATISSPTHPAIIRPTGEILQVRLAEADALPDRDFVLRWQETVVMETQGRAEAHLTPGSLYALMRLRAPRQAAAAQDWEQDVYFLVDRSGSMQGQKWEQCARALHAFVKELGERDRVWITCFESHHIDFSEAPMLRDAMLAERSFQTIAALGTAGGTELAPALHHVLQARRSHSATRRSRIVIITDGQVGNEQQVLTHLRGEQDLPVYCFGIDTAVNDSFLRQLSGRTGGRCVLMTPDDDIPAAVRALAESLRRPVLTGLHVSEGWELPEVQGTLTDLHAGEVTVIAARHPVLVPGTLEAASLGVTAMTPDGTAWKNETATVLDDNPAPRLIWAQRRIASLLAEQRKTEAIALAVEHNLLCEGAAFIAWDESEKVPVAQQEVYQPSLGVAVCAAPAPAAKYAMAQSGPPTAGGGASSVRRRSAGSDTGRLLGEDPPDMIAPGSSSGSGGGHGFHLLDDVRDYFSRNRSSGDAESKQARDWSKIIVLWFAESKRDAAMPVILALAMLLGKWATASLLGLRGKRVQLMLKQATASQDPLAHLAAFIDAKLDSTEKESATLLIAELRTHAPGKR